MCARWIVSIRRKTAPMTMDARRSMMCLNCISIPLSALTAVPVYVDESLAGDEAIVFNAGTHRDAIRMQYDDFVRVAKPRVCSFAQKE